LTSIGLYRRTLFRIIIERIDLALSTETGVRFP
jgi:hypothetical protein